MKDVIKRIHAVARREYFDLKVLENTPSGCIECQEQAIKHHREVLCWLITMESFLKYLDDKLEEASK